MKKIPAFLIVPLVSVTAAAQVLQVAPPVDLGRAGFGATYRRAYDPAIDGEIAKVNAKIAAERQSVIDAERSKAASAYAARNEAAAKGAEARVIAFLRERVRNGSSDAAADLAERHLSGRGVPQDLAEARRLMKLSVARGNTNGIAWLATNTVAPIAVLPTGTRIAAP